MLTDDWLEFTIANLVSARQGETFATLLPGLLSDPHSPMVNLNLSTRSVHALQRMGVRTWGDFAERRPADILRRRQTGESTLLDLSRVAVRRGMTAPPSATYLPESEGAEAIPHTWSWIQINQVLDTIALLAEWGARERGLTSIGELIETMSSPLGVPADVSKSWHALLEMDFERSVEERDRMSIAELFAQLLAALDDRIRHIFLARCLPFAPPTLQEVGDELGGISRERVRQIQEKAEGIIATLVDTDRYAPLRWRAHSLRTLLGTSALVASTSTVDILTAATGGTADFESPLCLFLLRLAGPYSIQRGMLLRADASLSAELLEAEADSSGFIETDRGREVLLESGILTIDAQDAWLHENGYRLLNGRFVRWRGSVVDKAVLLLSDRQAPMTPGELVTTIGEGHSARGVRARLYDDPRRIRVSKSHVALAFWGLPEYTGVVDEMVEELERRGGRARLSELVVCLVERFGISENSIRTYSQTPMFVMEDGVVRLRTSAEPYNVSGAMTNVRACYQLSPSSASWLIEVDNDVLRGSGRPLPAPLAVFLGVGPGTERRLRVLDGADPNQSIPITWPLGSATGPAVGSVRTIAIQAGATLNFAVAFGLRSHGGDTCGHSYRQD